MPGVRVSVETYVSIIDFLRSNKEQIESERLTQKEVIDMVKQQLHYDVGLSTVKRCSTIAGIRWVHASHIQQPLPLDREAIILMMASIDELYQRLGSEPPKRFADMRTKYVQEVTTPGKEADGQV